MLRSLTGAAQFCVMVLRLKLVEDCLPSSLVEADDAESEKLEEVGG